MLDKKRQREASGEEKRENVNGFGKDVQIERKFQRSRSYVCQRLVKNDQTSMELHWEASILV